MAYCEDYPCCGHTYDDPCERQPYDEPGYFDTRVNPHALCEHEYGMCDVDDYDDADCGDYDHECLDCNGPSGVWQQDGSFVPHAGAVWHCAWCDRPCPEGAHDD